MSRNRLAADTHTHHIQMIMKLTVWRVVLSCSRCCQTVEQIQLQPKSFVYVMFVITMFISMYHMMHCFSNARTIRHMSRWMIVRHILLILIMENTFYFLVRVLFDL